MRLLTLAASAALPLVLFAFASPAPAPSSSPAPVASTFQIDDTHSNVLFKVMHNNAAWFYGRFATMSGTFEYDESDPSQCSLNVEVRAESVDSGDEKLDQHLRSPDFFDAKQFPVIRFESTKVEEASAGVYAVTGNLTLRGTTQEVTLEVEKVGASEARGRPVVGFHTSFVVDRTEYGVNYGAGGGIGSDVELIVSIEAVGS